MTEWEMKELLDARYRSTSQLLTSVIRWRWHHVH